MPYPALPPEPPALTLPEAVSCTTPSLPEEGALTTAPTSTSSRPSTVVQITHLAVSGQSELDTRLTKTQSASESFSPLSTQLTAQAPDSAGSAPSLRPTPSTPGQKPFLPQNSPLPQTYPTAPSITVVTPSAYGKSEGRAAVGFSLQARSDESSEDVKGRVGISFDLGFC
jgi:hypothetical protein